MRVALVHAFRGWAASGDSDDSDDPAEAVLEQAAALGRAGHDVRVVGVDGGVGGVGGVGGGVTRTDGPRPASWQAARRVAGLVAAHGRSPLPALRAFAPDVVHVHTAAPGSAGSAGSGLSWTAEWTRPLVATLHAPHPGARLTALPRAWAAASRGGVRRDPLLRRADRVIVLSELSRDTYERAGLPAERLTVLPHLVPVADGPAGAGGGDAFVVVGRLTPEERVLDLLRHWPAGRRLDVVGAGPLEPACRAAAPASVRFLGAVERPALRRLLPGYRGLVHPGPWAAGAVPAGYPRALAAGLPVLAFEGSAAPRAVRSDGTGTVAAWDAPLAAALDAADRIFPTLREHCRGVCAKRYGERAWVERTEHLYAQVVGAAGG
ncbi:glycosyltransferase [Streptomyces sp. NPDC049813]|uniref:glycosyltransferase n=1 Tax=Streptomyces sp. NPDC049813 TaxID=3365597 RepID=UPI00379A7576